MDKALAKIRLGMRNLGLKQIDIALQSIERQLISSRLNVVEVVTLQGRCRELRMARWLVNRMLYAEDLLTSAIATKVSPIKTNRNYQSLWTRLYESTLKRIEMSLENQTSTPLEIDILKEDKKRELLLIILQELELLLAEVPNSGLDSVQLLAKIPLILSDLWRSTTTKFFGKYSSLNYDGKDVELVNRLLGDQKIVEAEILNKIPFGFDLCNYVLFKADLVIDNSLYGAQTPEAIAHAETVLSNLLIQVANAVMQPLLNHFADVEEIKQRFYTYNLIATREVERFRNNLSWHYRLESYWGEAQAIYESQYHLFRFSDGGIIKMDVYAPRSRELSRLSGIPLLVTLLLELQDAIAPRLRSITAFIGTGLVYILKNVLGRGIGLIGKGIIQGIGDSFSIGRDKRRSDRF